MPRIIFTAHAKGKFAFFKRHKIIIRKKHVIDCIEEGHITDTSEYPKLESAGDFDEEHSLITIYRKDKDEIVIITFWVAEKGRYESKIQ